MELRLSRLLNWQKREQEREELLSEVEDWMGRAAGSYQELARIFSSYVTRKDALGIQDKSRILEHVSERLCRGCIKQGYCWEHNLTACYEAFCVCIAGAEGKGEMSREQLPEFLRNNCISPEKLVEELNAVIAAEFMKLSVFNQMMEGKEALVRQLQETANYLYSIPDSMLKEVSISHELRQKLKWRLRRYHVKMRNLSMQERRSKGRQLQMTLQCEPGRSVSVKLMERLISELLGHPVRERSQWSRLVSSEEKKMVFLEEPEYFTMTGVARSSKQGQEISGDSFSFLYDEDGEMAMILSDGMGSGEDAARESEMVLNLLERLLLAGFGEETAIRLVNSVLALRAEQKSFATLDMSMINLYTGTCEFIKIGGVATFLKRGEWLECVAAETLPIGMMQKVDYDSLTKKLYDGDYIIMMSDGVLDAVPEQERREFLHRVIGEDIEKNPQVIAGRILNASLQCQNYEPQDDMTVLVCGIFKKNCHF